MNDIPDWDSVEPKIEPIAKDYLETVKDTFENAGYEVSDIGKTAPAGGIGWDITITTDDDETIVVSFEVIDSLEYEGETLGYNVSLDAVAEDGRILIDHTPKNYTDEVWTMYLEELKNRAKNIPELTPNDLE